MCKPPDAVGDPILASTGNVFHREVDYRGPGPRFARAYNSATPGWVHNYMIRVVANSTTADVIRPDGKILTFTGSGVGSWSSNGTVVGRLEKLSTVAGGPTWKFTDVDDTVELFDASGVPLSFTPRHGRATTFQTANSRVQSVTDYWGRKLFLQYDGQGRVAGFTAPDGQQVNYGYDGQGRLEVVTYADGTTRRYVYENAAKPLLLTGVIDETNTRFVTWTYDSQGRATESSQALGSLKVNLNYDAGDAKTIVTDSLGRQRALSFATVQGKKVFKGQDASCADCRGDAASKLVDGANGLISESTDYLGVTTLFTWDSARKLQTGIVRASGRNEQQSTTTEWHPTLRLPTLVTEQGRTTAYTYDARGNRLSEVLTDAQTGQQRTKSWTYNSQGLVETMTDARGAVWRFAYDNVGDRTSVIDPTGRETKYTHDGAGRVLTQASPGRPTAVFTWDVRGRLLSQAAGSKSVTYTYTPTGQVASAALSDGLQVNFLYDAAQRLTGAQDNRGASISYTLDAAGNRIREEVKDERGQLALVTARVINSLDKVVAIQGSVGQATQLAYDANGEPVSETDPLNQTTRQTLDALRRPTATTFPDNTSASQAWNQLDQLTQLTDPKGVATQYTYNAFGEVMSETSPDIGTIKYTRDAAGQVIAVQDAKGQIKSIVRDVLGRPTEIRYAADHVTYFTYNGAGDVMRVEDASGTTSYERDEHGRVTAKTQAVNDIPSSPSQYKLAYGYSQGNLTSVSYPSGLKVFYRRVAGRIVGIDVQEPAWSKKIPAVVPLVGNLTHTPLGVPRSWTWSNGAKAERTFDADGRMTANELASYTFDAAGRITSITQQLWVQRIVDGTIQLYQHPITWQAGYDSRNRLTSFKRTGAETSYTYDANSNRLTAAETRTDETDLDALFDEANMAQATSQALKIEEASNRLLGFTQTTTTMVNGQPMTVVTTPINYAVDANGAMISDGLRSFEYDASNRLAKVKIFKDGEAASIRYLHNALAQRVFKSEPQAEQTLPKEEDLGPGFMNWLRKNFGWMFTRGKGADSSLGMAFVYGDGGLPQWALLAEIDNGTASGRGTTDYIWLPTESGQSIPIGMYRNGKFYAIHTDHLGTPRLITNSGNEPVWQWPYSAFGNNKPTGVLAATTTSTQATKLKATKPPVESNLRFPGQYFDEESNLSYNYLRSYNGRQGRYTQADPIGLEGGTNRFSYAGANPVSFLDPDGLLCIYSQSTGSMTCTDALGQTYYNETGYAGTGNGRNNPAAQGQQNLGPLPQGQWEVTGSWYNSPNTGKNTIRLTPLPGNQCAGTGRDCSSFRLHGNNSRNDASRGCIVLPPNRTTIPSGEVIEVTP